MRKFHSLTLELSLILFTFFSSSCESLGFANEDTEVIPFEIGDSLYFSLQDMNSNSQTYGELIGPQSFYGKVVLLYFTTNET